MGMPGTGQRAEEHREARPARRAVIVVGRSARTGANYRVEAPDRVLRMFAMLTATRGELDLAAVPPGGRARIHRLLETARAELKRSVSPALARELTDLVPLAADPGPAELRVEYAGLLGWTSGLVVAMLDQLAPPDNDDHAICQGKE